jgi:predicted amidohydrolase YtcJ
VRTRLLVALAGFAACRGPALDGPADLVVRNARVYTVDARAPWAAALAVRDGRFVAVGAEADVATLVGPATRVVDVGGRLVLPGFHDAHVHVLWGGRELGGCEIASARSPAEIAERVAAHARAHPERPWILAHGWDQSLFPDGEPPADFLAAELAGDPRPVLLSAGDGGHSAWANARALELAGVGRDTPDPPHGRIERDAHGAPSGVLREEAVELVARAVPRSSATEDVEHLRAGLAELARAGIVACQDAAAGPEDVAAYRALDAAGGLPVRVRLALMPPSLDADAEERTFAWLRDTRAQLDGPRLTAGSVKLFLDGVIEGGTAALLEPYLTSDGAPDVERGTGILNLEATRLAELVRRLDAEGFQVHAHAIGDRAIRLALDAIEAARHTNGPRDARHHLAHVQLVDPADLPRFAALGVAANVQALWAHADGYITELTEPVLGPARSRWLYPIGSLVASGAVVVGGSDWPVTALAPLAAIQVALTRTSGADPDEPAWLPEERAGLAEMIAAYTLAGAWLEHAEEESGSIEVGKLADFVLLERDIFTIPPAEIGSVRVLWTVLEGGEVFRADGW